ncbi:MAG: hypothetical protein NC097_01650 [Clostridium sp.]|nr:hypothetical protein [Prevotella sp.]MCM1428483.1 hypothetical protein [Clostridium sp.]MCM1475887.1 hypothetical protein [Muribaculaceae bacterium]
MKRVILIMIALMVTFSQATAVKVQTVQQVIASANYMLSTATTPAACDKAAAKYASARKVPGYSAAKHEKTIQNGINKCAAKKKQLAAKKKPSAGGGDVAGGSKMPKVKPSTPISPSPQSGLSKLRITDISFCNTDVDENIISGPGFYFYFDDVQYICPKIYYEGLTKDTEVTFTVKIYTPSGELFGSNGKTYDAEQNLKSGSNSLLMHGWGNSTGGVYYDGDWRVEIWQGSRKLTSGTFTIEGVADDDSPVVDSNRYIQINKMWVDHNQWIDGVKGMKIHVDFNAVGMKDHEVYVAAYFYYEDDTSLKDVDDSYCTVDGQVCVFKTEKVIYDNSHFGDFVLFIPNDQIHASDAELKFVVRVEDNTMDDKTEYSEYFHFTIGNP